MSKIVDLKEWISENVVNGIKLVDGKRTFGTSLTEEDVCKCEMDIILFAQRKQGKNVPSITTNNVWGILAECDGNWSCR